MHAFHGIVPNDKRFLGGETIGALFERVLPAMAEILSRTPPGTRRSSCCTAAVNRAILSHALTGERMFLGALRAGAGLRQRARRRRRVDRARGERVPARPCAHLDAADDDGAVLERVPADVGAGPVAPFSIIDGDWCGAGGAPAPRRSVSRRLGQPHLSFDTSLNMPSVNFWRATQPIGNWSFPFVTCLMPGSENGFASFQLRARLHERRPRRVLPGLVQELHEGVGDGHSVVVERVGLHRRARPVRVVLRHHLAIQLHGGVVVPRPVRRVLAVGDRDVLFTRSPAPAFCAVVRNESVPDTWFV